MNIEVTLVTNSVTDLRAGIFFVMSKGGWPILELRSLDPSLEEVFLSITSAV
jgi:ABC-2 type transport system ATP-binding protein